MFITNLYKYKKDKYLSNTALEVCAFKEMHDSHYKLFEITKSMFSLV
jgi:hypothetical protein